jgi:Flp pilus assembly protein TadD
VNYEIGWTYSTDLNQPHDSARYFQAALAVRPDNSGAWLNLGRALARDSNLAGALRAFQRAAELRPDYATAYNNIGTIYRQLGQFDEAVTALRKAVELQPQYTLAQANLGFSLRATGDLDGAVAALQEAVDQDPQKWMRYFVEICHEAGELQTAVATYRQQLNSRPISHKFSYELAALLRYLEDVDGYREVCRTMFKEFGTSEHAPSRHSMLLAHVMFPDGEVTSELLEIARKHAERDILIRVRLLGMAYYRIGDDQNALQHLKRAATLKGSANSQLASRLCLALVQVHMQQFDAARESIQQAHQLAQSSNWDKSPWGAQVSLWREVRAASELAGLDVAIPDLPPAAPHTPNRPSQ